jgi:hypothetical protein
MKKAATKKTPAPFASDVKNLPPELARLGGLTPSQKRRDEKYRDKMIRLHRTAARLSEEERGLAHAHLRIAAYRDELTRLQDLLKSRKRFPGGQRKVLTAAVRVTANNLSEAYADAGQLKEAHGMLALHDPRSSKQKHLLELSEAIARPDTEHCKCPPAHKSVRKVYVPERAGFVDLIVCACGHKNATSRIPRELVALHRARTEASAGASDQTVLAHAKKIEGH